MECKGGCKSQKLSKEFPKLISDACNHPSQICFRCCRDALHAAGLKTPLSDDAKLAFACPACSAAVSEGEIRALARGIEALTWLETEINTVEVKDASAPGHIFVVLLDGRSFEIDITPQMTLVQLKTSIEAKSNVKSSMQRLILEGAELVGAAGADTMAQLGVAAGVTLQLLIVLADLKDNVKKVKFDLWWGYPAKGADYLDGSALVYAGAKFQHLLDYSHTQALAFKHSGDIMDHNARRGHHIIDVDLTRLPADVTHVFFTLSAWNSPSISHYPNPSVTLLDGADGKSLANYSADATAAGASQALVLCRLRKIVDRWTVEAPCRVCSGNAKDYNPIRAAIERDLIN